MMTILMAAAIVVVPIITSILYYPDIILMRTSVLLQVHVLRFEDGCSSREIVNPKDCTLLRSRFANRGFYKQRWRDGKHLTSEVSSVALCSGERGCHPCPALGGFRSTYEENRESGACRCLWTCA